ncbi:MAG TPA: hypothetical protein PLK76_04010 [bacterium]|nr:hypothetical protein [bacterium]
MDLQNNEPVQGSQNIWTIVISVVATVLVVGGGLMFYQKTKTDVLSQEIQTLKIQNESIVAQNKKISQDLVEAKKVPITQELPSQNAPVLNNIKPENTTSSLCTAPATATDSGRDVFPIDPKYKGIEFLGQLFTAFNCGPERVSKIFGVKGSDYTLGSTVWLKSTPSDVLSNTFKSIGYKCADPETSCKKWELWTTVKINDLMKLKPFHENFEADDCTNCG